MTSMRLKADLTLLLAALIWGLAFVAQRTAAEATGILIYNASRFLLGGIILLVVLRFKLKLDAAGWRSTILVGLILGTASFLQQAGMRITTAGNAGFITAIYVVLVPLWLALFWKRKTGKIVWVAALITLAGGAMLSGGSLNGFNFGDGLELLGAGMWAFHVIFVERMVQKVDVLSFAVGQYLTAGLVSAVLGLVFEWQSLPSLGGQWLSILYTGIFSTAIAFTLQALAQRHAPPADAAVLLSTEAVFAALAGWLILNEQLAPIQIVGAVLILAAVLLVQMWPKKAVLSS